MKLDKNFLRYNNAVRTVELYQKRIEEMEGFYGGGGGTAFSRQNKEWVRYFKDQ
ncbi:MAG: hypothetical protein NC489_45980 [Ruminococcus flavefaciens]|nr:hypothetical protein [Ruminococcus flavefaciens]